MVTIGPIDQSSPSTRFYADFVVSSQSQSGNYSTVTATVRAYNGPSGTTGSQYNGSGTQTASIDGVGNVKVHSGNPFLPGGYSANQLRWSESGSINISHDANGNLSNKTVRMTLAYGSINVAYTATLSFPRIPKAPAQVTGVTTSAPSTVGFTVAWTAPNNNGSTITGYDIQYSTSSSFASGNVTVTDTASPLAITGLTPGTTYYVRVRAKNAVGTGPYSATATATTLPSVPPGLTVTVSPSGTSVVLTFTPPGGVSGVTKYTWERRVTGTTSPVATGESTSITTSVTGLTPGTTYDWRASAWIGTYQSPWSTWQAVKQPKPNTNPGDYFDGNTTDTVDLDYAWTGTANNSTSTATAQVPIGWEAQFVGGAGVLYRVTAGEFGPFAARVVVTKDTTGEGSRFGQQAAATFWSQVTPNATYVGSIHVFLTRSNNMAAEVTWLNDAGGVISRTVGTPSVVPAGDWFRMSTGGVAPGGAAWAVVKAIDVSGAGWVPWQGGDTIDLDGAMVSLNTLFPYFDGDFLPDGSYTYAWTGTANASTSTRTPEGGASSPAVLSEGPFGLSPSASNIVDPDCNPGTPPPRPPTIPSDCIDTTGVWRRTFVDIPSIFVSDWLASVPTLQINSDTKLARQVRIRYYPNPLGQAASTVDTTSWCAEQIVSYMPPKTTLTIDGVTQRVWAEVNNGDAVNADHLLYGTGGTPATWPILSCGIGYVITLDVPVDSPEGNVTGEVFLTTRT